MPDALVEIAKTGDNLTVAVDADDANVRCTVPLDGILYALERWDWESVDPGLVFDILGCSRLAIEALEWHRLCSYTEKSQRYITLDGDFVVARVQDVVRTGDIVVPQDLLDRPSIATPVEAIRRLKREVGDQVGTHVGGAGTLRGRDGGEAAGQVLSLYP